MSYCLNADYYSSVGTTTENDTVFWAINIEPLALTGRNNLTDVEFFVPKAGNYTLQIFSGDEPTGTALHTQTITAIDADTMAWKTIHFTSPIAINQNQDLWIVFSNSDVTYPAAGVVGNQYDNGKWISIDGIEWMSITAAGLDYTWMIRAISDTYTVLPPTIDIYGPSTARVDYPTTFVAVSSVSNLSWQVDGSPVALGAGDTLYHTFTTTGLHQVVCGATNTAGTTFDTLDVDVFSCDDITLPYAPVFTDALGCWDTIADSTHGAGWFTTAEMGLSEGQVLSFSAQSYYGIWMIDFPVDNWLISPEIEMPSTGEYEIAWKVKPYDNHDGDHYGVYVIDGTDTTLLFEEDLTGMIDYNQRMAVIPSTITGNFKVAFRHFDSEGGYVIILDSIQIRNLTAPVVTLEGPASVENGFPAIFVATAPNASSLEWAIDGTPIEFLGNVLINTFTTDGLHTVSVTAYNTVGSASDSVIVNVFSCTASDVPFTMDFESALDPCWYAISMDDANDDRFGIVEDDDAFAGDHDFQFSSYSRASDYNQYLLSPELNIPATGDYIVRFAYKAFRNSDVFCVLTSSTDRDLTSFDTLVNVTNPVTEWTEVAYELPQGTKYVAINYYGDYAYYLNIDNLSVTAYTAPEVTIYGPATTLVDNEVSFTAVSPLATSFTWAIDGTPIDAIGNSITTAFSTTGTHTVTVTATNRIGSNSASATITVTECDHITSFPYVQDFETANVFDCWLFVDADGDGYNWNTDYLRGFTDESGNPNPQGHNGSNGLAGSASWAQTPLTPDNWMILPAVDLPAEGSYILSWFEKGQDAQYAEEHYSVYISTTGRRLSDFTNAAYSGNSSASWVGRNVDLSQYAGQTVYIAFRHHDVTDMFYLDIDDIMIATNGVGIDEVENSLLSLYPNPASSIVTVSAEGVEGTVNVQVVDLNGRVMMEQNGNAQSFRFDVSSLAQGAYFVRLTGENVSAVSKLVVK